MATKDPVLQEESPRVSYASLIKSISQRINTRHKDVCTCAGPRLINAIDVCTYEGPHQIKNNNDVCTCAGPHPKTPNDVCTYVGPQPLHNLNDMNILVGPNPSSEKNPNPKNPKTPNDVRTCAGPHPKSPNDVRTYVGPHPSSEKNDVRTSVGPHPKNPRSKQSRPSGSSSYKRNTLTYLYTNADVLTNKLDELVAIVNDKNPDIIGICEVLPKSFRAENKLYSNDFKLEGYDMIPHPNIDENKGRGSILYIKSDLTHMPVEIKGQGNHFQEHILQEVKIDDNDSVVIALLYRSPSSTPQNNTYLLELLKELSSLKTHLVSMGDINLKNIDWENMTALSSDTEDYHHKFIECLQDLYLTQHVQENTRQRGNDNPSCLDLVITSDENYVINLEQLAPLGKSDHSIIKFETPYKPPSDIPKIKVCYDKGDYTGLNEHLSKIDWEFELNKFSGDVEKQWEFFTAKYLEAESKFIPRKKIFINGKLSKKLSVKFDKKTLALRKKKNRIWSKMRKNLATEEEKLGYRRLRNKVKSLCAKAKKIVEKKIAKNAKSNPKGFWAYTQSKLKSRSSLPDLIKPGTEKDPIYAKTDEEKAEVLVEYFSSVFTSESDIHNMPPFDERVYDTPLENIIIDKKMVQEKLEKLKINKSPGPDKIHPRVLNNAAVTLALPLSIIFNTSLQTKTLPKEWKHANISAIFKKGKKTLPQNYRPVSLTSIVCKIMESIIRDEIVKHMKNNNLFSQYQFGFISGRSTVLQLLHVLNLWIEVLDQGGTLDAIYCDFMKAFDKVPHKRLVYKVEKYGIKGNVIKWIESFLNGRTQCVSINNHKSSYAPVTSGIPQGSVLGPILFVIYINDLPEVINGGSLAFLFADDTKMFRQIKLPNDLIIQQKDIENAVNWSNIWLLKFHPDKCVHLGIGSHRDSIKDYQPNLNGHPLKRKICEKDVEKKYENDLCQHTYHYDMDGHILKRSKCEKDIGVNIDNELNFKTHINSMVKKANRVMGITRRTFTNLNSEIFLPIFKGLVRPQLEYAAPVWSPHLDNLTKKVEDVQRRATKRLPGMHDLEYPDRLRKLKLPTLAYRRVRGDMIQVYKMLMPIKEGGYDRSLPTLLKLKSDLGIREVGGHNKQIYKGNVKHDLAKYSFNFRVSKPWNSLPQHVIDAPTVKAFEIALDNHWGNQPLMFDNYESELIIR